ncbi:hypothetical protein EPICR_160003 [Candidatus Desulfarcum epimagneticum]|uniref:Teneurin-like YD-shell domain-containing protein n=1 Tax=uncultured Desulfobacteraceae bacterium TaxID=218296 RepID=A0A484HKD5_9BACT|nr:hypothetical protein EPICR_160003 [uncultured Desulfobacteraceae bacterium]
MIDWTSFDKPSLFTKGDLKNAFFYGPDRARYKKTVTRDGVAESVTVYIGKDYEKVTENGQDVHKYFVYAEGQLAAVHKKIGNAPDETRYMRRDFLGSIDTVTNGLGDVEEKMAYAPFGSPRSLDGQSVDFSLSFTNRGFTGHEHIDDMGIIHMNGRVYDPEIGRFLSPDGFIQDPYSSQSFNRYTYCLNNPLQYTDPSGQFFDAVIRAVGGAIFGGVMAAISGGDILEGMITGAVSAVIFGFAGDISARLGDIARAGIHAAAGVVSAGANGLITGADSSMIGQNMLINGFSAGVAKYGALKLFGGSGILRETMGKMGSEGRFFTEFASYSAIGGVTGGMASSAQGGDFGDGFAQGARTAAFGYLFNWAGHEINEEMTDWLTEDREGEYSFDDYFKSGSPEEAAKHARWLTGHAGGLDRMPELANSAAVTLTVAESAIWGYSVVVEAYPLAMATADRWAPYAQELGSAILSHFGEIPPTPPDGPISTMLLVKDITQRPENYFNLNRK